ncbi:MAG: HNH endonuclease, partial [Gemmataceae bacterium]
MSSNPAKLFLGPRRYAPVGRCIYCGATKPVLGYARFADEHIIPLALGGDLVLPEAVCKRCEITINKQIETPVLVHEWRPLRDKLGWPTRKPSARKGRTHATITMIDGSTKNIPLSEHSTPTPIYEFDTPNILSGLTPSSPNVNWRMVVFAETEKEATLRKQYPAWNGRHTIKT